MRSILLFAGLFICCIASARKLPVAGELDPSKESQVVFIENKGQVYDQNYKPRTDILYSGRSGDMTFYFRNDGISYQMSKINSWKEIELTDEKIKVPDISSIYRLDVNWLNCNKTSKIAKGPMLSGHSNYYTAACPDGVHHVKSYSEITYEEIYKGISMRWYQKAGKLKYDYMVSKGANYWQIQLEIKGATEIKITEKGELYIETPLGSVVEDAPLVYQSGKILKSKWLLKDNIVSFDIADLNPELEFTIDPLIRVWGTYYGSTGDETAYSCNKDKKGNIYIAGLTTTTGSLLATVGSHQGNYGSGSSDAYLAKFNASGVRTWCTYYGGTGTDLAYSCCADTSSNIFMAGRTDSNVGTVIASFGSHQQVNGGGEDGFIVKFDSAGVRQWGTYYGGGGVTGEQIGQCIADQSGNVYAAGRTSVTTGTVIATAGSHQTAYGGGNNDAFLVKFNSNGTRQWATYYGGTLGDYGIACARDNSGNIYLAGGSQSTNNISTPGSHQAAFGGGIPEDAFLVKFNSSGVRLWGTYYGGSGVEYLTACGTDLNGNIYLSGQTSTTLGTIIASPGSHQQVFGGTQDAFLVKFDGNGTRQWGTYYGDGANDACKICFFDSLGNVYIGGMTPSTGTVIPSANGYQTINNGGTNDAWFAKFNSNGLRQWGTYYGGAGDDWLWSGFSLNNKTFYLAGQSTTTLGTMIASPGCFQPVNAGGTDAMLVKFTDCDPDNATDVTPLANQTVCVGSSATLNATGNGTVSWYATPVSTIVIGSGTAFVTQTLSAGTYTFYAELFGCALSPARTAITVTAAICTSIKPEQNETNEVLLYPNPTNGIITVEIKNSEVGEVAMCDLTGRLIIIGFYKDKRIVLDLSSVKPGLYFLKLKAAGKGYKIIKE